MSLGVGSLNTNRKQDPAGAPGPPFALNSADNGLSVDPTSFRIVLGQDPGAPGNPGGLINDREIPLAGRRLTIMDGVAGSAFEFFGSFLSGTFNGGGGFNAVDSGGENISISAGPGVSQLLTHAMTLAVYLASGTVLHNNTGAGDPGANNFLIDFTRVGIGAMGVARLNVDGAITNDYWVQPATTTPYPVNATAEKNFVFTNDNFGSTQWQLPAAAVGLRFTFYNQDVGGTQIDAGAGDTLRIGPLVTAAGGSVVATAIGDSVTFQAINATEWVAVSVVGTWV